MQVNQKNQNRFIFLDESGRRWKYLNIGVLILVLVFLISLFFIIKGLVDQPVLNHLKIGTSTVKPINQPIPNDGKNLSLASITQNEKESNSKVFAFYQSYNHLNNENKISFRKNIHSIDVLIPDWFYLNKSAHIVDKTDSDIDSLAKKNGVKIIPQITLDQNSSADNVHEWLSNPQKKEKVISDLLSVVKKKGYDGIHLNFESVHWEDKKLYNQFVADVYKSFHSSGLQVTVFVRLGDDTYDSMALANVSDHVIVKAFDQHIQSDKEEGPLASFVWTQKQIEKYKGPKEKLIISLANYGYDWNKTSGGPATALDFPTIMELVARENLKIQWNEDSLVPYVRYKEKGQEHIIEFLDAATFYNQMKLAKSYGIPSIGIWNIGSEDPSIWKILSNKQVNPSSLESISNTVSVVERGSGDFLEVKKIEAEGKRLFKTSHHFIVKEKYESYPTPYQVERYGTDGKKVAITFDGGPSPKYTQEILDILHRYNVNASFFLSGKNASLYSGLVKNIYNDGHEIGSNMFTHINVLNSSDQELAFELNATQRVIQGITGQSTILLRPPSLSLNKGGEDLTSTEVLDKMVKMQDMGYTLIGASINSRDLEQESADEIFKEVKTNVKNGEAILLHDAGGDQSPTIEALPKIIEWLQDEGYSIVPTSELVGKNPSDVMPALKADEKSITPFYFFVTSANGLFLKGITILMYILIGIGLIRLVVLLYYSYKQKRNSKDRVYDASYRPFVSIVIAAYNEEKVIRQTIQSIMNTNYQPFELIIVDDGSTDQTASVVEEERKKYSNISLIRKENGGKSSALNIGFQKASAEILLTLDADTQITDNTISNMVRHFIDPNVGAVSGNVKIGNHKNLLTLWQHIEYVCGFNFEKRAFDELNCIPIVPGAIGAWRKSAVKEVDCFEEDTLAEDTDLTLKLLRNGYSIRSEVEGIAYTEAPENVKSFIKQRYRWTYGILQCLWKHKGALFNKRNKNLGLIAMPNMYFQYMLLMTAFLADILFIMGLITKNPNALYFYIGFLLFDTVVAMYSFILEKENKKPLLTLFIQRLVYRQFFTFVVWKSIIFAIKGGMVGWNKLQRTGNVQQVDNKEIKAS